MGNRVFRVLGVVIFIFVIAACTSETVNQETEKNNEALLEERLEALQGHVVKLEDQLMDLAKLVADNNTNLKNVEQTVYQAERADYLTSILEKIVMHLSEVSFKQGYISEIIERENSTYIVFEYVEMLSGEDAIQEAMRRDNIPREDVQLGSGFLIKKYPDLSYQYPLSSNSIIYIVDQVSPKYLPLEDFLEYVANQHNTHRYLFNFTITGEEIVVIQQQYLP